MIVYGPSGGRLPLSGSAVPEAHRQLTVWDHGHVNCLLRAIYVVFEKNSASVPGGISVSAIRTEWRSRPGAP